jgi:glyoxylase-like metal-dependent hydrolase (beta-lactamase superfamily II)
VYFQPFYLTCLSHASYLIGSEGEAAVIDPQRDVAIYLEEARAHGFTIRHIIETHLHADFVSGHRELAAMTGAAIHVSGVAKATFPHHAVKEGDEIRFGECVLRFLETPGHTPEGVSVLVTDLAKSSSPFAVLTGDTLFVGDVGRPDLSAEYTPRQLAGMLFDSLHQKLLTLPDDVEVYPAHGAGSLCGRNMGPERSSTIGRERKLNYALQPRSRDEFIDLLTRDLPDRPGYFAQDVEINRAGADLLEQLPPLRVLQAADVQAMQNSGAVVLDTRPPAQFAAGHVPGSIQIGLSGQYASWAAILLGLQQEIILIAENDQRAEESRMRLARVGIERVKGYLQGGIGAWSAAGLPLQSFEEATVEALRAIIIEAGDSLQILDVRRSPEWDAGHVPEAIFGTLSHLDSQMENLDRNRPVAVYCKSGYRSTIAASLLQRAGFSRVINTIGGFDAWQSAGLPLVVPS